MDADYDPLARIPGESSKANQAFCDYALMGTSRNLRAILSRYIAQSKDITQTKPPTVHWRTLGWWSARHRWVERAEAYDAYLQKQARIAQVEAVRAMNERHIAIARMLLSKVEARLKTLLPGELSPAQVASWVEAATKLERLSRGEATERVDVYARVRKIAKELGLSATEEAEAVAAAERIVRGES